MALVRLLVVDDFHLWRDCIKEHLEEHPDLHVAGFASDGLEALQKVEELQPDLVILDISLPKLSGIETARRIRRFSPNCKILFLTGHSYPEMVRGALEAGGCGYVHKEDALTELFAGLDAALAGRQYLSSSVVITPSPEKGTASRGTHETRSSTLCRERPIRALARLYKQLGPKANKKRSC